MINLLGDTLWRIIDDYFAQGYFDDIWHWDKELEREVYRDDILWRLELRENKSRARSDAFSYPFRAVFEDNSYRQPIELETLGVKEALEC